MKKVLKHAVFLLTIAIAVIGCGSDNQIEDGKISLKGTKWKLEGIVSVPTGELKALEPKDCKECYTIIFNSDYVGKAYSVNMTLDLDLSNLDPFPPGGYFLLYCEKYFKDGNDYCDSQKFRDGIKWAQTYSATPKELKLYFLNGYNYLLFKP